MIRTTHLPSSTRREAPPGGGYLVELGRVNGVAPASTEQRTDNMRHFAYIKYLAKHKTRVLVHSLVLGMPLQGILHDASKLTSVEYYGIGRQFFPSKPLEKDNNAELFKQAKAHHNLCNRHHLEHWYNEDGSCREIPLQFCMEIICDWAAVQGCAFSAAGIKVLAGKSYLNWGKGFRMHPATRQWFTEFLEIEPAVQADN